MSRPGLQAGRGLYGLALDLRTSGPSPGRAVGRALPGLVRLLGRLPGGHQRRQRQEGLHPLLMFT